MDTQEIHRLLVALRECEQRLTLLIDADRHKLLDVVARNNARAAIADAERLLEGM